jgi:hypothetical protein
MYRELLTYGDSPYPKMTNLETKDAVLDGYRMPPPSNCTKEIYSLMSSCW